MAIFPLMPVIIWLLGLGSSVLLGYGLYYVISWFQGAVATSLLMAGLGAIAFTCLGRYIVLALLARPGQDEPNAWRSNEKQIIRRPDGTQIHVEFYGSPNAQPLIFTHGWSVDSTYWYYLKEALADEFRLIIWDIPGMGQSDQSPHHNYSMEKLAGDLEAVLAVAGTKPAVICGHSMGGMILLTFCRLFPQHLGTKVSGLGLLNTTFINPVNTSLGKSIMRVLQKPLLEPLLYLMIGLWPIVWVQNWLSFFNGSAHLSARFSSFGGKQTMGQLDYIVSRSVRISPAVLARQMLGMFHYNATEVLSQIHIPTLIISANKDRATVPDASRYMHEQIDASELVILAPSGHITMLEQHEQLADAIANFARRCDRALHPTEF